MSKFKLATVFLCFFALMSAHQASAFGLSATEKACADKKGLIPLQIPIVGACVDSPSVCCSEDKLSTVAVAGAPDYISAIFRYAIIFLAIVVVGVMVVAGLLYISSGGNPAKASKALDYMRNAAYSLVVLIFSVVILNQVDPRLTSLSITPLTPIKKIVCCEKPGAPTVMGQGRGAVTTYGPSSFYFATKKDDKDNYICDMTGPNQDKVVDDAKCTEASLASLPNAPEPPELGAQATIAPNSKLVADLCETTGVRDSGEPITSKDLNINQMISTYGTLIDKALAAKPHDARITRQLVAAVISIESNGVENATNKSGALGLMQVLGDAAISECGLQKPEDLLIKENNIPCGILLLDKKFKIFGTLRNALASYNGGGGKTSVACTGQKDACGGEVKQWECLYGYIAPDGKTGRLSGYVETRNYVHNMLNAIGYCPGNAKAACE